MHVHQGHHGCWDPWFFRTSFCLGLLFLVQCITLIFLLLNCISSGFSQIFLDFFIAINQGSKRAWFHHNWHNGLNLQSAIVGGGFFWSLIDVLLKVTEHAFTERLQAFFSHNSKYYTAEGSKQFFQQFVSCDSFLAEIWARWLQDNLQKLPSGGSKFSPPFQDDRSACWNYAVEGVPFQFLFQMPSPNLVAIPFWWEHAAGRTWAQKKTHMNLMLLKSGSQSPHILNNSKKNLGQAHRW